MVCSIAVFLLFAGAVALAQEDPWPPLITTCNVMPLLAADANTVARDLVACASTSYPTCEVINCQVISNSDQVELELLPCWQHPAMWIKSRKIDGTVTFQDIFASSRIAQANIGGDDIKLNVTAIQRNGLTLGFGLDVILSDGTTRTIFPYRDIPLNLTECPGANLEARTHLTIQKGAPSSLSCKMILYMEQFIISSASTKHNPMLAPTCNKPPGSCDSMQCYWTDDMGTNVSHTYNFLRCSTPQSVRFILTVGTHVYNMTFSESKIVQLNTTTKLNFTLLHPSETTIGLAVSLIKPGEMEYLMPYSVLPLDRSSCVEKEGDVSASPKVSPLITTCEVMALLVNAPNANYSGLVKCTGSTFPNCEAVNCLVLPTKGQFEVKLLPCLKPPGVSFVFKDVGGNILFKDTFNSSRMFGVNIDKYVVNVSVTIIQGNGITLGFGAVFIMPLDHAHVPIFPFREIPLTFTECPGELPPNYPLMCKMIDYMEQYIVSTKSNSSYDPSLMAMCDRPPATCDLMNCYWKDAMGTKTTQRYTFQRCSNPQTVGLFLEVGLHVYDMSFSESKMVVLNMTTTLNFTLLHPTKSTVGIAVTFIVNGNNNVILPYTVLPMDKNGCKSHREMPSIDASSSINGPDSPQQSSILPFEHLSMDNLQRLQISSSQVISTCDVMPYLAWSLNNVAVPDPILNCSTPSYQNCELVTCEVIGTDDTFMFMVLPCTSPPSFVLTVRNSTGDVIFNQSISKSMQVDVQLTAGPVPVHFTVIKHANHLTLGLSVEAQISEGNTTTLVPYFEVPLNTSQCPGAAVLTPTCKVTQNLAQYLTTYMTNLTRDTEDTWNCVSSKKCLWLNCTYGKTLYYVVAISACDKSLTLIKGYTNGTITFRSKMAGSGIHSISANEFLTAIVQYHPDTFSLELQVTVITTLTSNSSVASPFIPRLEVPLNLTECADNKTASSLDQYLIDTCVVMPQLANLASDASDGVFECSSLPRPYCNKIACRETFSGDMLTMEVLPCYRPGPPKVSIVNTAVDGKVTMNEVISSSTNYSLTRLIGGHLSRFTITVANHAQPLTVGLAISINMTTNNGFKSFDLIPYSEIPLDFTYCPELAGVVPTATCRVMDSIAQFLNVYIKNDTHKNDGYCTATRESYCNSIYCKNSLSNSGFNMTFLPCGPRVAYHTADSGSDGSVGYNFTIYTSSLLHFTPHIAGNITLYQVNTTVIIFGVMLIVNNVSIGYEVPFVTIPLDRQGCNASAPQSDPYARVSTCDVMPSLAASASAFAPNILRCTSSQDCSGFRCHVSPNDNTLEFQVLPCYNPPSIRVMTTDIRGGVLFNKSYGRPMSITPFNDGRNAIQTNLTIVHHQAQQTLGLKIDATLTTASGNSTGQFVPYFELPLDRTSCLPTSMSNRTETCKVMDALAQYMTVFFVNATRLPGSSYDTCYVDHGPSSLCNSIACNFLSQNLTASLQFQPCNNPVGLTFTYYSNRSSENATLQRFIFRDTFFQISQYTYAMFNITPHGSDNVDFQMSLESSSPHGLVPLLNVPFTHIPLDSAVCSNNSIPDGHHNHTHNNNNNGSHAHNHTSTSIADLCTIMPSIAREVSRVQGSLSLQCTTPFVDCNTLHCFISMGMLQQYQQNLSIIVLPCTSPPQLEVSVPSGRGGSAVTVFMKSSDRIESVINGSTVPIFFNINQRASLLSLGLEVIIQMNATSNITLIPYKEIPLDRSDCQTTVLSSACASLSNISQYLNYALSDYTVQPTDCSYNAGCDGIHCSVGRPQGTLSFALQPCDVPPSVLGTATFSNGTEMFDRTIVNNQIIPWNLFSEDVFLNITLLHYSPSMLGFELNLYSLGQPVPTELVPSTIIPLITSACSTSSPTLPPIIVTNSSSFITTCDIMPLVALSTSILGTNEMECSSSSPPDCSNITCSVPATHDGFTIELEPCFYPPSIRMHNMVNGRQVSHKIIGKTTALNYTIGGQAVPLTVELHQHTDYLSLGLQVFATLSGRLSNFIPYREIPVNRSQCTPVAPISPTCLTMEHVSQYITVFMGNASNIPYKTPDCFPDKTTFCNRITCQYDETREVFNFTINPCSTNPSLGSAQQANLESIYFDGRVSIFKETKTASSVLRFLNAYDANLIFNNLDNGDTVQLKLTVTSGEFAGVLIPMVTIPLDKSFCHKPGMITTPQGSTSTSTGSSETPQPKGSNNTNLIIAITVGAGGIFLLVIIILCGVVFIISCQGKKMSEEPYAYRPLSDAEDAEDRLDYSIERSHPRPVRDREDEQQGFPASRDTERRLPRPAGDDKDDY